METAENKEELRQQLLAQREAISEPEFYGASATIIEKLKEQKEYQQAQTIHCYVSINKRREVETKALIWEMIQKGREVVVPVTNMDDGTLTHIRLQSFDDLEENKWGVLEPATGVEVSPQELELVIVPMVGADRNCNRIGYGKGFYDRFLEELNCPTVGLIFDRNVVESIPTESFDVPLEKIITEKRILKK
ncbi:5-formyltetrahydrofolate cyclo-ligase [Fodinibius sp. Rm-B-1B1-1]|uniref:5-formyltetrahydrofolate cyclo-ligase n=1 Tax=Fodinibius alkaliphilus TaxID=3140241 RepID=UPI00315AEF48